MVSCDVTRRELSLGARDLYTGWCAKVFTETTIEMVILPKGQSFRGLPCGNYARYDQTGFASDIVYEDDEIKNQNNDYFKIQTAQLWWWLNAFSHRTCDLVMLPEHADRAATSGTWHLDGYPAKTDQRYTTKLWLDTYLAPATYIHEDNGTTDASVIVMFAKPDYGMRREFIDNALDAIAYVDAVTSKPLETWDHHPYCFEEMVSIRICAINKTGITATNLIEQFEQAMRRVATAYPLGSVRSIDSIKNDDEDLGGLILYSRTVTLKYKRWNTDYTATYPTFSYGIGFTYEGDRLTGGAEGLWTEAGAGTTTVNSERNLNLAGDTVVETVTAGNNLGLDTDIYTKARIRYKTSGGATLTVATDDETILTAATSATWTTVEIALTGGNTLDHLSIHNAAHAGNAYLDFIQIYTGNYTLPNVTHMTPPFLVEDADIPAPGRSGGITQALGSKLLEVHLTCDLDMAPISCAGAVTNQWKRGATGQTAAVKTDYNNIDALLETAHLEGSNAQNIWIWLDLGEPAMQFKARLREVNPDYLGEANKVELVFREYRHGGANTESMKERFGTSL